MRSFLGRLHVDETSRLVPSLGFEEWRDANVHHCSRTEGKKNVGGILLFLAATAGTVCINLNGNCGDVSRPTAPSPCLVPLSESLFLAFSPSWTTHHFSLFVIPRSFPYFPQLPPLISGLCHRRWRSHLVLTQITNKRRPLICHDRKQPRLSWKTLEN